ncbi:MAG TPA: ABC transporter substrate-binding protein [Chloroflexota bacterium]|nr:ABC transporter substrate-binding protein [Chloroflexota bacterium]
MVYVRKTFCALLVTLLVALVSTACSGGAAPAPTKAPDKAAPAATSAPAAPAAAATTAPAAAPAAATSAPAAAVASSSSSDEIRIGGIFNITGQNASQGALYMKAADLAVKQINAAGGVNGKKINLMKEDAQSTNPGALAALNKTLEQNKPLVIAGPNLSTQLLAMSDTLKAAGIPMTMGGTNVTLTKKDNPWFFRMRPDDSIAAAAIVLHIKENLKLTKVGIINDTDAYGAGGGDLVDKYCKEQGLQMVRREQFTAGTKDYTSLLLAMKSAGAQVIAAYVTRPEDAARVAEQYRGIGSPFEFVGAPQFGERDTLSLAKGATVGLNAIVDFMPGVTEASKKYLADYDKEYPGQKPDTQGTYMRDSIFLYTNVIKKVGEDRNKIREAILSIKGDFVGACGTYNFTPNGDGLHANTIIQVDPDGNYKFVKTLEVPPSN